MTSLAHYKLGDRVGADRLTEIYRATDTALGRTVTIRLLRPEIAADSARRDALVAAARRALPLSHPNIATLFQIGEENSQYFFVFEHTPGETLRAAIAGSPLNPRRAVDLGEQLADALAEAHAQQSIHGWLNPDSIVLTQKGRVKILGFGLPSIPPDRPVQSDASLTVDEVECLAPERVLGATGDARADIFSLGCVLFEMLTGRQPFSAATAPDTMVAILGRTPPPPSQANARVPEALDRLVERCLVKSLDGRADSAATIAAELREIGAGLEADERTDMPLPLPSRAPRRRRTWLIVLLIVLCLAGLAAVALLQVLR
jgi:serine/threonine protein kinase